ncbi:MAG: hypothetical protein RMJ18_03005 [Candidatus Aenigmarchaeota archaeon]|nr:hypothetical protein [Candidatus Aenigmarchaeota archaeon]MDW8160360.1 hypothetical protein [Candidatus Aenigmarchaeota archaeon]
MGNEEDIIEENKYKNEEKNKLEETEKTLEEIVEKMEKWEEEYRKKEIGKIKPIEELSGEMVKKIEEVRNLVLKKLSYVIDDEDIIKRLKEIRIEILDIGSNNMAHFDPKDEVIRINERFLKDEIEKKVNPVYILGPTLAEEFMHAATHMIEKYRGWSKKDLLKNIKDRFEKIYQPNKTLKDIVHKKIGQEFLGHLALLYFIEETKKEVGEEDKEKLDKIIRRLKENYPDEYVSYIIKHLEMDKNFYSRENIKELNKSLEGLKNSLKNLEVEILREFRKVKEKIDYNTLKEWRNEIEKINKEWKEGYQKKEIENKINQIPDKIPVLNETIERLNKEIQKVVEYIDEKSKELEYRVPVNKMGTIAEFNYGIKDFINSTRSNLVIYLSNYVLELASCILVLSSLVFLLIIYLPLLYILLVLLLP